MANDFLKGIIDSIFEHRRLWHRWQIDGETMETDFIWGAPKITASGDFVFQCFLVFEKQIPLDGDSTDVSTI